MPKPPIKIETTTLWDYPSQHYDRKLEEKQADFEGATPAYIIWNLLQRYTKPKDLVVDPMCGSGTTLDVARDLGRRALGYDLAPTRRTYSARTRGSCPWRTARRTSCSSTRRTRTI